MNSLFVMAKALLAVCEWNPNRSLKVSFATPTEMEVGNA